MTQGRHYGARTEEVLRKSEDALDEFVGPAMNITQDNEERNVSQRGEELAWKLRKSARYLERSQRNQDAFNNALSQAVPLLDQAASQSESKERQVELSSVAADLLKLSNNRELESTLSSLDARYQNEGQPRLDAVQKDTDGVDVSHHGRPLWNLFESSMIALSDGRQQAGREVESLDRMIERLQTLTGLA